MMAVELLKMKDEKHIIWYKHNIDKTWSSVSNSSLDFGGGSSSCSCCCCDRGEIESTPSPKTEVWTLDLGLEFDKNMKALRNLLKNPTKFYKWVNTKQFDLYQSTYQICLSLDTTQWLYVYAPTSVFVTV